MYTLPLLGSKSPAAIISNVVLPLPFGPIMVTISPLSALKVASFRTSGPPGYSNFIFLNSITEHIKSANLNHFDKTTCFEIEKIQTIYTLEKLFEDSKLLALIALSTLQARS